MSDVRGLAPEPKAHAVTAALFGVITVILAVGVNFAATPSGALLLLGLGLLTMALSVWSWIRMLTSHFRGRRG